MEKEFEIFQQAEKTFYNSISPIVSMIKELIFKKKQHSKETNYKIQFTIVKSLKYYRIKRYDANIFQKVHNKLKSDFKEFNIDVSIDINCILTNEYKTLLEEAWRKYIEKIEPILVETRNKIFIKNKKSLSKEDIEELKSKKTILMFDALPNYDYKKSKFKTYTKKWISWTGKDKYYNIIEELELIDIMTGDSVNDEIEQNLCIRELINNLDDNERLLVLKHFYHDKQLNEIARQFEISAPAITKRYKKTLEKLKNDIKNECL